MQNLGNDIKLGTVGVIAPLLGFAVSQLQEVEIVLRVISLSVGIAVGIASFVALLCKLRKEFSRSKLSDDTITVETKTKGMV